MSKKNRQQAIEELTLALLYLTRFDDEYRPHVQISWKGYDFDSLEKLEEKNLLVQSRNSRGYGKHVYLTDEGIRNAQELLKEYNLCDTEIYERFEFREIRPEETDQAVMIEKTCFPPKEACSREQMEARVKLAPDLFLVAVDRETGKIAGFLNGIATTEDKFRDEFFMDASLHDPKGKTVMLCGLDVLPAYRKQGLSRELMHLYCRREEVRGRRRLVLTCHASKVKMYRKLGFIDRGDSNSAWGGEKWHEMDYFLNPEEHIYES